MNICGVRYSIVVCSHNGGRTILECLKSLFNQSFASEIYEIIVVDDGSTDNLAQVVQTAFADRRNCSLIRFERNRGLSAARNAGWQTAQGEIVLYIDDDAVADPTWLEQIVMAYTPSIAGVGGLMRPYTDNLFARYEMGLQVLTYGPNVERLSGAGGNNMSFRRSVLEAIGGFDERFVAVADDADINRRLLASGYPLIVRPAITVRHRTPTHYRQFWKKKIARGRGSQLFKEKYDLAHHSLRDLAKIVFFALAFPFHLVKAYQIKRVAQTEKSIWGFALLSWLDRVGTSYGEFMQRARQS